MALSKETEAWITGLKAEGNLSDEVLAQIRAATESNPRADEYVRGSVLRQSDYSRQSAEVQRARQEAEAAQREAQEFHTSLTEWKSGAEGSYQAALAAREAAELRAQRALGRLQTVAAKYGAPDEDTTLEGFEVKPSVNNTNFDPEKYAQDLEARVTSRVTSATSEAARLDAIIYDLGNEHQALFGRPLPAAEQLVNEALASKKTLRQYWEDKYYVPAKRTEVSESLVNKRIQDEVDARMAKMVSEGALPHTSGGLRNDPYAGSPVLKTGTLPAPSEAGSGKGLSAAVAAFQSGAYKVNPLGR